MQRKEVPWGILGTANIAAGVGQAMDAAQGAELVAVASRDGERARSWGTARGLQRTYAGYEALLEQEDIEAVYIPLPPSLHMEWTIKAAERGKHVLCEKPLAANAAEARAMVSACRANQVQLMDGVMWVHHRRTAMMKEDMQSGTLGPLRRVTAAFSFNWDEIPEDNIRVSKELGGGALGDLGYYCVRAILWAFDELPVSVYAAARFHRGVDFNLAGLLWFEGERMASFDCGFDTASRRWFEVAGTRRSLVCDDFVVPADPESSRYWIHGKGGDNLERRVRGPAQTVLMIERFSEIARSGELQESWPREALDTMRVCDALLESARRREKIEVDQGQ